MSFSPAQARELAMSAMIQVITRPDLASSFLDASGLRIEDLRALSHTTELAVNVLDFVLEADSRVLEVAEALTIKPQDLLVARTALSGPGSFGWEAD